MLCKLTIAPLIYTDTVFHRSSEVLRQFVKLGKICELSGPEESYQVWCVLV